MTRLYLNQLISRNKYLTKLFSIFIFLLLIVLFGLVSQSFSNAQIEKIENDEITNNFADEINPFCDGLSYFDNNKLRYFDLTQIEIDIFNDLGYNVQMKLLNAANYGVPQKRERVIFVGVRNDITENFEYPIETHNKDGTDGKLKWVSVKESIDDLKDLPEDPEKLQQIYTQHRQPFIEKINKLKLVLLF